MTTAVNTESTDKVAISEAQILDYRHEELHEIFASLPEAEHVDIEGAFPGKLTAIMGIQRLPRFLVRIITRILQTPLVLWAGKGFYGDNGANLWFTTRFKIPFGFYTVGIGEASDGCGKVVHLNYDIDKNIGLLRPITGEARKVGDDFYLARMMYRTAKNNVCVLYFTLKK